MLCITVDKDLLAISVEPQELYICCNNYKPLVVSTKLPGMLISGLGCEVSSGIRSLLTEDMNMWPISLSYRILGFLSGRKYSYQTVFSLEWNFFSIGQNACLCWNSLRIAFFIPIWLNPSVKWSKVLIKAKNVPNCSWILCEKCSFRWHHIYICDPQSPKSRPRWVNTVCPHNSYCLHFEILGIEMIVNLYHSLLFHQQQSFIHKLGLLGTTFAYLRRYFYSLICISLPHLNFWFLETDLFHTVICNNL